MLFRSVFFSFARFSVFLSVFQVLPCDFLIFLFCQFCRHNLGPTVCISCFSHFTVFLAIFHPIQCVFLIVHDFQFFCLTPVSQCIFVIFHAFQFSCHIPGTRVCISPFPRFSVFLAIFHVWFSHFP